MLKLNFYFVQRCARQSPWPSFMEFEWQNSRSVGTGGRRHRLNWRNMADCCFLDHHLYLGFYQSRLTFTSSTHMFYSIHKISLWLDCPWCWGGKSPLVENEMGFFLPLRNFWWTWESCWKEIGNMCFKLNWLLKLFMAQYLIKQDERFLFFFKGKERNKGPQVYSSDVITTMTWVSQKLVNQQKINTINTLFD